MRCPRCGFHNMPGLLACGHCAGDLQERTAGVSVYPPRASGRRRRRVEHFRQRLQAVWAELRGGQAASAANLATLGGVGLHAWRTLMWGDTPARTGAVRTRKAAPIAALLGIAPGLGHLYCGHPGTAAWLGGSFAVLAALELLLLRTSRYGVVVAPLYLLALVSFVDAWFRARVANGTAAPVGWQWLAQVLLLTTCHLLLLGGLLSLFPVITVNAPSLEPDFPAGTRFLGTRLFRTLDRGDYVACSGPYGLVVDRVVGGPGDVVEALPPDVRVNGDLLPRGFIPGRQPAENVRLVVPPGSYAVFVHEARVYGAPGAPYRDSLETVERSAVRARIVMPLGPGRRSRP